MGVYNAGPRQGFKPGGDGRETRGKTVRNIWLIGSQARSLISPEKNLERRGAVALL